MIVIIFNPPRQCLHPLSLAVSREQCCMAIGEMLTKLPADAVAHFAAPCVAVLVSLVNEDREWGVIDAACAALALLVFKYPATLALGTGGAVDAEVSMGRLPSASAIAQKMFEILPLNVGHAASVLVVLMRLDAAGVAQVRGLWF